MWKSIKNYEGLYEINRSGDVKSVARKVKYKNSFRHIKGHLLKQHIGVKGYSYVPLAKDAKSKLYKVARLVALNFIPNPENKPQVNHKDGNKLNNNVDNLEWVTNKENNNHGWQTGLMKHRGENHPKATLKDETVLKIRALADRYSQVELVTMFKSDSSQISRIINRKLWKHL